MPIKNLIIAEYRAAQLMGASFTLMFLFRYYFG